MNNAKFFWKTTNEIIFNKPTNAIPQQQIAININNSLISNPVSVANHFNNYYINIANNIPINNYSQQIKNSTTTTEQHHIMYTKREYVLI